MSIIPVEGGGGHGGKAKLGKNGKVLLFGGGLALIGALLVFKRSSGGGSAAADQETPPDYYTNYPTLAPTDSLYQDAVNTMIGQQGEFFDAVIDAMNKKETTPVTTPAPPTTSPATPTPTQPTVTPKSYRSSGIVYAVPKGGWDENSLVDKLKSQGRYADFEHRTKLAKHFGITNYTGTEEQNKFLLNKVKADK